MEHGILTFNRPDRATLNGSLLFACAVTALLTTSSAEAQTPHPGTIANSATIVIASGTLTLPAGWHTLQYWEMGGGGGSGCGVVVTTGTAGSGGATGGSGLQIADTISSWQVGGAQSLVVTIGAAGTACVASGTTSGSSGSAASAGTSTSFTLGSYSSAVAFAGGAGANGQTTTGSGGGATGNLAAIGNSGSAGSGGTGANGGIAGGSAVAVACATTPPWVGCGGNGAASGSIGVTPVFVGLPMGVAGPSGSGLATVPVPIAGKVGVFVQAVGDTRGAAGSLTCTGTLQNGGNATYGGVGIPHGVPGGSGASCAAANGGNGGNAGGYGSSGAGGGDALIGFTAGNGGASTGGVFQYIVSEALPRNYIQMVLVG